MEKGWIDMENNGGIWRNRRELIEKYEKMKKLKMNR